MSIYIVSDDQVTKVTTKQIPSGYDGPVYHVADSNKKYTNTPECAYLIFSTLAVVTCPNRTRMCGGYLKGETPEEGRAAAIAAGFKPAQCYALIAEKVYPQVKPARKDNTLATLSDNFVRDMTAIIKKRAASMRKPKLIVRIHESGDFYSKKYAEKWLDIASACQDDIRIEFWVYTKSFSFFDGVTVPENFHLIASVWGDTKKSDLEVIARNGWRTYSAVEKFTTEPDENRCHCANCGKCGNYSIQWIRGKIH